VRHPGPCVRALCESGVLFQMSHLKLHTSHFTLHSSQSTLHLISAEVFPPHLSQSQLFSSHLSSSHMSPNSSQLFSPHLSTAQPYIFLGWPKTGNQGFKFPFTFHFHGHFPIKLSFCSFPTWILIWDPI